MTEIRMIHKKEMKEFLESDFFKQSPVIPISTRRAMAQVDNPNAEEEDTMLYLVFEGEQMVAYLGTFPDKVQTAKGLQKCAWLSCIWVHSSQRGKGLAKTLVETALRNWNQRILITEFTPQARRLYDKIGVFEDLGVLNGKRYYCRLRMQDILPPKSAFWSKQKPALKIVDALGNAILDLRFLFKSKRLRQQQFKEVRQINADLASFIQGQLSDYLFPRSVNYFQWMISQPWLEEGKGENEESRRYHFTLRVEDFKWQAFQLCNQQGEIQAFVLCCRRDGFLKVPVALYKDATVVADFIHDFCDRKTHTLTLYDEDIIEHLRLKGLYVKSFKREYLSSFESDFDKATKRLKLQSSEGDSAFT
ncbi:MAG: GNAT family N-acetyltransferase [Vicingaceae bacterium]